MASCCAETQSPRSPHSPAGDIVSELRPESGWSQCSVLTLWTGEDWQMRTADKMRARQDNTQPRTALILQTSTIYQAGVIGTVSCAGGERSVSISATVTTFIEIMKTINPTTTSHLHLHHRRAQHIINVQYSSGITREDIITSTPVRSTGHNA